MIDSHAAAWSAGIIDGEGTITIVPRYRSDGKCKHHGFQLRVSVANTDEKMINRLKELWGGSIHLLKSNRDNRRDIWSWVLAANNAMTFLSQISKYLVTKSEICNICMEFQSRIESNKSKGRAGLSDEEISARSEYFWKVKELNHKGPWLYGRKGRMVFNPENKNA